MCLLHKKRQETVLLLQAKEGGIKAKTLPIGQPGGLKKRITIS
jgi:hypothetical protein